jgi:hypothetical protein
MNYKQKILRYWLAMNATAFDAAIHALVLFCGVAGAHEATQWVPALNLQQLGWVFLIAFGRAILAYVEAHPVAATLADVGRVPSPGVPESAGRLPSPGVPVIQPGVSVPAIPPCEGTRPAMGTDCRPLVSPSNNSTL